MLDSERLKEFGIIAWLFCRDCVLKCKNEGLWLWEVKCYRHMDGMRLYSPS